jgi:hypothetical protein
VVNGFYRFEKIILMDALGTGLMESAYEEFHQSELHGVFLPG